MTDTPSHPPAAKGGPQRSESLESETIEITKLLGFRVERNSELGECDLVAWNHVEMTDTKYQLAARGLFGSKLLPQP